MMSIKTNIPTIPTFYRLSYVTNDNLRVCLIEPLNLNNNLSDYLSAMMLV